MPAAQRPRLPGFVVAAAIAAAAGLLLFAAVLAWELAHTGADEPATTATTGQAPVDTATAPAQDGAQEGEPVSLLPAEPEGVTILEKRAETGGATITLAPVAAGAQLASGHAMDLGSALSFQELTARFSEIAQTNGPENFQRLEPRAILRDTAEGLEARLLVGPFDNEQDAGEACEVLILPRGVTCRPAPFEGELIPRD